MSLALIDYGSRNHEIEIRPSSVRGALTSEPNAQISFKFWLLLALCHTLAPPFLNFFENKTKINWDFFLAMFVLFVNMGPFGSKLLKTLLLLKVAAESFQTFPEISSQWSPEKYCFEFLKF